MANQEGVDIIIKATDQYTKTINNITASNELFGKSVKNTEKEIAALERYMIALRVNGVGPLDKRLVELKATYDNLSKSLNSGEGAVKKTNMQFTNLALVIQDLPFGFRGIQNNLPALLGSIAGVGGAAYLAFSTIVALYTAFGDQINQAILQTTNFEKAQKELGKSTIEAAKSTETARTEILKISSVIQAAKDGYVDKSAAIQLYNDKLGDSFGKVNTLGEAEQALIDKAPKYVEALMLKAKAEFYFAKASEFAVKKDIAGLEDQTSALDKLFITANTVAKFADVSGVKGIIKTLVEGIGQAQTEGVAKVQKTAGAIADVLTEEGKKSMSAYFKALKESGLTDADIQSIIDKLNQTLLKTQIKGDKEREQATEKAQNVQISNFIDTLNEKNKEIVKSELKLQEDIAALNAAGFTNYENAFLANKIRVDAINKKYNDKEIEEARKKDEKIANDKIAIQNRELQNTLDALKIESDVATKVANSTGRSTASERITILEKYRKSLYDLAYVGGWTAEQFDKISDAILRVDGEIKGSQDNLRDYKITWTDTMNSINKSILDFVANSINYLAESLGKALAGEKIEVFKGLALLLADSLIDIGKALVAYAVPVLLALTLLKKPSIPTAIAAIGAGIAAIATGSLLKSKLNTDKTQKFANGGIISGPTMGLMGEYPGAASNPEVVAPLDKLKDLIGGGTGTLEARISGNDLLILMNKASRNNNNTF
jgi:hypothetical protein